MDSKQQVAAVVDIIMAHVPKEWDEATRLGTRLKVLQRSRGDQQLRDVVGVLYDGLAYGNWPWSLYTVEALLK